MLICLLQWFALTVMKVGSNCPTNTLAVYELKFKTLWDKRDFPKHYPEWRPPASWSKLLGYSHDSDFKLYRKGEIASDGLKQFVETGQSDLLDLHTQGSEGVLDSFHTSPIGTGVGKTKVTFSADGNHTKISLVSKIMPSPDWFVGVDSYDLCVDGRWIEYRHLEAGPLDGGTDRGLTFTSPNWPSDPPEKVRQITSHFPDHRASSFYYPEIDALPAMAEFTIKKLKEYARSDRFEAADYSGFPDKIPETHYSEKEFEDNAKKKHVEYIISDNLIPDLPSYNDISSKDLKVALNDNKWVHEKNPSPSKIEPVNHPELYKKDIAKEALHPVRRQHRNPSKGPKRRKGVKGFKKRIPTGDAMAVIDDIVKNYQKDHRRQLKKRRREERRRRRQQLKKIRPPRDCRVSDWAPWGPCSKSCGIGEQTRSRRVLKHPKRGGKHCPALEETTWCGSARPCQRRYFNWGIN